MMKTLVHIGLTVAIAAGSAYADSLALVASDSAFFVTGAQTALLATGKFTAVDIIDAGSSTPTLATLSGYTDVLAWTNLPAADSVALGNVLADFYDLGGKRVTVATFALATGGIDGRIRTAPYGSLVDTGNFANPSGLLVATAASDPVFSSVNLAALTYYHNKGFVNAGVATGATLLATDGSGINMIARSSNGVVDINLYPGLGAGFGGMDNNDELYRLVANTFASISTSVPVAPTANPGGPYSFCPQSKPWLLDGSHSVDPELGLSQPGSPPDQIVEYAWDLSGTGKFSDASGPQPDVTAFFTNLGPGIYPAQL